MKESNVIFVLLRQPRLNDPRPDPFWEFGSFGCTSCHNKNLMNPNKAKELNGKRLAFAQGGPHGFKLVLLSPPIITKPRGRVIEAKWKIEHMPFRYDCAPLIIDKVGNTDIPSIINEIRAINRQTWLGKFSSAFRSRRKPVSQKIAGEIIKINNNTVLKGDSVLAVTYVEALPFFFLSEDKDRRKTYESVVNHLLLKNQICYNGDKRK